MKKMILIAVVVFCLGAISSTGQAFMMSTLDCEHIEFAELQTLSKAELTERINYYQLAADSNNKRFTQKSARAAVTCYNELERLRKALDKLNANPTSVETATH